MDQTDVYKTIKGEAEGYFTDKRSRFLAFAHHVKTAAEVKDLLDKYRKEYHDARHICWAYRLGYTGEEYRYNDDGEPSSTAGKPIYGQMVSHGVTFCAVFVVRYFGGIELGTSGLIVAYRSAAMDALKNASIEERFQEETVSYDFPYTSMDRVMKITREMGAKIVEQTFDNTCSIRLSIRQSRAEALKEQLKNISFS